MQQKPKIMTDRAGGIMTDRVGDIIKITQVKDHSNQLKYSSYGCCEAISVFGNLRAGYEIE